MFFCFREKKMFCFVVLFCFGFFGGEGGGGFANLIIITKFCINKGKIKTALLL